MIEVYTSTEQVIRIFVYIIIGMVIGTYFRFIMAAVLVASRRDWCNDGKGIFTAIRRSGSPG